MDIVSRLKKYMDYRQIAISQFADTCFIPRPTISQILNGRNKKISDELIGKIHAAYPELSIVWLMFGEGDMLTNSNIKTSEAKNDHKLTFDDPQISEHEIFSTTEQPFPEITEIYSNKSEGENTSYDSKKSGLNVAGGRQATEIAEALSGKIEASKKITSIVVFYADNTFQTFNPS